MLAPSLECDLLGYCADCGALARYSGDCFCTRCGRLTEHRAHDSPERLFYARYLVESGRIGEDISHWPAAAVA